MARRSRRQTARKIAYSGGEVGEDAFRNRVRSLVVRHVLARERVSAREVLLALRVQVRSLGHARRIAIEEVARAHTQVVEEWFARQPDVQAHVRSLAALSAQAWALRAAVTARGHEFRAIDLDVVKWTAIVDAKRGGRAGR